MVPMGSGKGFRCSKGSVKKVGKSWIKSGCEGVIWNNTTFVPAEVVERAKTWPIIARPTAEQNQINALFAQEPAQRGGRLLLIDAGPGTAKTTTVSWSAQSIHKRRKGDLFKYPLLTFNKNAANVALEKLPIEFPDVATLNSWHGRAQGFTRRNYDTKKLNDLWKELTEPNFEKGERPRLGIVGKIVERMRDVCLFTTDETDTNFFADSVNAIFTRFGSLARKAEQTHGAMDLIRDYLPAMLCRSHKTSKKVDLAEQISRPVADAISRTGWKMRFDCVSKRASEWTNDDVRHFASLIRTIQLPQLPGAIVDEGQDLSLCQIAVILAQVFRNGELAVIGDDASGQPGDDGYKAGQAIYGWRGAFGGSFNLIGRLWEELTGEAAVRAQLTKTFRHGPEICAAYRPLNTVIQSALPAGKSEAWIVDQSQAFTAWINLPPGETALWITRTNAPLSKLLIDTLKSQQECCIRGNDGFMGIIDGFIYNGAGWPDTAGEYPTTLAVCLKKLEEMAAETEAAETGAPDPNSMERFVLELGKAIQDDPTLLVKAGLEAIATVGNLRRFIAYYADRKARRVLTTVYRCKGDEADVAIVDDSAKFNESWGDSEEDAACRHVALSRGKRLLLTVNRIAGSDMENAPREMFADE
jgi:hypothetical protein